jgi:predicted ATP-grasp superfamily ATP-dependent carboligase
MNRDTTALVTGVGGPAGRAVQKYLQEHGVEVVGTDMRLLDDAPDFRLLPPASQPEFVRALLNMLDQEGIGLLVPTVSEELPKIAEQREVIRGRGCDVFMCSYSATTIAGDKWQTMKTLRAAGISVPRSFCGGRKEDLLEEISPPVLSKPREGRGGRGIILHNGTEEIPELLPTDRIYQEFMPGQEYDVNLFAKPEGKVVASVVLRKTKLKSGTFGNALAVERADDPEVEDLAERATRALCLEGPIDIDIRRGEDGRPAILEVNARFAFYLPVNYFTQILVPLLQLLAIPFFLRLTLSGSSTFTSAWNLIFYFGLLTFLLIALYSILLDRDARALRHLPLAVLAIAPLSYFYNFVVVTSVWRELRSKPELWEKIERLPSGLAARRGGVSLALMGLLVVGLVGGVHFLARPALLRVELSKGAGQAAHSPVFDLAVATHFDAWQDWHEAVSSVLKNPNAPLIQTIGLSAGRPEWAYFRWEGHSAQWSAKQKVESADILGESVRAFKGHGFQTVAIVDVYATNLIRENPRMAAVRFDGVRSPDQVCFTELADGTYGQQIIDMVAYLARNYPVDAIALTELGYESSCFDDRCLMSYRRATGRTAWPTGAGRTKDGRRDASIWEWRSARMEGFLARVAGVVHGAGKKLIVDVPVSWDDLGRNGKDSGLDYKRVLRHADQIVVWDYFGSEHKDPSVSQVLAESLRKEFAANRVFVSIGLWGSNGTLAPREFQQGLAYGQSCGEPKIR